MDIDGNKLRNPTMKKIIYILLLLFPLVSFGQEIIHGLVINKSTREPIYDAVIRVYKKNIGTQTDFEGKYLIKATLNDTLVVSSVAMKTQMVKVNQKEMNFELEEIILEEEYGPPGDFKYKDLEERTPIKREDIENANNPKYNFKKNAKKNVFVIFVAALTVDEFNPKDLSFQEKYNVKYSLAGSYKIDYVKAYNKLTFKYLKKKYKKSWLTEIRKDAIGLEH